MHTPYYILALLYATLLYAILLYADFLLVWLHIRPERAEALSPGQHPGY